MSIQVNLKIVKSQYLGDIFWLVQYLDLYQRQIYTDKNNLKLKATGLSKLKLRLLFCSISKLKLFKW